MPPKQRGRGQRRTSSPVEEPPARRRRVQAVNYAESSDESPERGDLDSDEEDLINNGIDPLQEGMKTTKYNLLSTTYKNPSQI